MAEDTFDSGWGDDPFSGDIDFDMDFDGPKPGFLKSVTTGFLQGLVENTVGSSEARINSLKMALPKTYTSAFSTLSELARKRREALDQIKGDSVGIVKDLQYLAGRSAEKIRKFTPNRIADGFTEFSQKDFSGWEKASASSDDNRPSMGDVSDDEVAATLSNADANSALERGTAVAVGETIVSAFNEVGGRSLAHLNGLSTLGLRTNQLLNQVVDYQRNIQSRNDAMKLNILTRTYLTNAKFYKFMEASQHRMVTELKSIGVSSAKSDYEKTTTSQAMKKSIRDSVFDTAKRKVGGLGGFLADKFGQTARAGFLGDMGDMVSSLRMASEMSEGMDLNYGQILGNEASRIFINNLPRMIKSNKGQEYLKKFKKQFPDFAKRAEDAYARIADLGNVASYGLGNAEGLVNTMAKYYQGGHSFNEAESYEEYLNLLDPNQTPLKKFEWEILNRAKKMGNAGISGVFDNMSKSQGSRYDLRRRTLDDSHEPAFWSRRDSRTLNETIVQWLSQIHLSVEKFRTGDDNLKVSTYDYVRGKFISANQKKANVLNDVFNKQAFSTQAEMALRMAENIDKDGALSEKAKQELAFLLTQDADKEMGFSPYNYLNTHEENGLSPEISAEIKKMIQAQFGITDDHVKKFKEGTDVDRGLALLNLPTEEARARAAELFESFNSLQRFAPDISNRVDVLKASGFYDALKEAGVIKVVDGVETVDMDKVKTTLKGFIKDPKKDTAPPVPDEAPKPSRPFGGAGPGNMDPTNTLIGTSNTWLEKIYNLLLARLSPGAGPNPPDYRPSNFSDRAKGSYDVRNFSDAAPKPKRSGWNAPDSWGDLAPPKPRDDRPEPTRDITSQLGDFGGLKESIDKLTKGFASFDPSGNAPRIDLVPLTAGMDKLNAGVDALLTLATDRNKILMDILTRQPSEKKGTVGEDGKTEDDRQADAGKRSILDRLKQTNLKDLFNNGVDKLLDQQPLILGGLLGGLAGLAVYNPKAAALLAGGAAIAGAYGKYKQFAATRTAESTEDLYEEGSETPILEANKLQKGDYLDMTTGLIMDSWNMITGSVKDIATNTIIGARRLAGKLFTADNKEVFIAGLSKTRNALLKAYRAVDPFARVTRWGNALKDRFYQMDVYKEGEDSPTLVGKRFSRNEYFKKTEDGELKVITGWNEIDGPVYDADGNILITQEECDRGLKTSMGVSVNKLQDATKKLGSFGMGLFKKLKDRISPAASDAADRAKKAFKADYTPIVSSVDRIYYLLLKHWGYKEEDIPMPPPPPELDENGDPIPPEDKTPEEETPEGEPKPANGKKGKKQKKPPTPPTLEDLVNPDRRDSTNNDDDVEEEQPIPKRTSPKPKTERDEAEDRLRDDEDKKSSWRERLNSLADKRKKAKEKKAADRDDAIIRLADNIGEMGDERGGKKKPTGLFGMLTGALGFIGRSIVGIGTFFTKTIWNGLSTLFSFARMGLSVLPAIGTGVTALAKGLFTLFKTGSLAAAGTSLMDVFRNRGDDPPTPPGGGPGPNPGPNPPSPARRALRAGKVLGAGLAADAAADYLKNAGVIEEGSLTDTIVNVATTGATIAGGWGLATSAAAAAGYTLTAGGVISAVGTAGAAAGGLLASGLTALAPLIFNPVGLAVVGAGALGYGIYKYVTRGSGKQYELRMAQYGISDPESDLAKKVVEIETLLTDHVVIGNARASLAKDAPIDRVMQMLLTDPKDKKEVGDVFTWFTGRFKPVFMTYMACLDVVKIRTLKEYDDAKSQDVYKVAKQVHEGLVQMQPYPYSVTARIDRDTPIMGEKATLIRVNNLLEDLKAYIDRKSPKEDLEAIPTTVFKDKDALQREKAQLEEKLKDTSNFGDGSRRIQAVEKARNRVKEIDAEVKRLNASYRPGGTVTQIYIKDLLPDEKAMDLLTAIRVGAYGNTEDIPWRVEAVLKLERYCEALFADRGDGLEFTGQIGDLFGLFKDAFRVDKSQADDWCLWFRDRFLPVLTTYMTQVKHYRKGRPGVVWKTLSVTARYEIAKALIESKGKGTFWFDFSIWSVRAAPFKDAESPGKPAKIDRMLVLLGEASTKAKLKDPEGEAGKTNASTWAKTVSPHKVGGDYQDKPANLDDVSKAKTRRDLARVGQYGTAGESAGTMYGQSGVMGTPANKYGFEPLKGDTDTSHLDMSGVKANEGNDRGVSVPKRLAQQILIREMLKQGFTDPRDVAQMLALTDYESGGYSRTTENMKYSNPAQLVKLFKEVKNIDQARQLIQQGEVAIANTVYGGAKGASLGNRKPGDGWKYRGRGFIQLTGLGNYEKVGKELGIDLVNHPELASTDPNVMAAIAVNFYKNSKQLRSISQTGNFGESAKGLNGGNELPGMDKRYQLYLGYLDQLQKGTLGADGEQAGTDPTATTAQGMYGKPAANDSSGGNTSGGGQEPMIGGNLPSLSPSARGGQSGGGYQTPQGSYSGGGADSGSLVNSNAGGSNTSGLRLKSQEAVAGGPSHKGVERLGQLIQQRVPNFKHFTALNDAYHHSKPGNSKHKSGLAIDFTLTNGINGSDRATAMVTEMLRQAGLTPNEFMVINEYRKSTANSTGGHVHAHFNSPAAAQKFYEAAGGDKVNGEDTTGGGMVAEQEQGTESVQRDQPVAPPQATDGGPVSNRTPVTPPEPQPKEETPPRQQTQVPLPNNPQTKQPQSEPKEVTKKEPVVKQPPPVPSETDDLLKQVLGAMQSGDNNTAVLLKGILDELVRQGKNSGNTPDKVRMN